MSSKFVVLGLLACLVAMSSARSLAVEEDFDNSLGGNEATDTPTTEFVLPEEWIKLDKKPNATVIHELGEPLELECAFFGSPPPKVKWIQGAMPPNFEVRRAYDFLKINF